MSRPEPGAPGCSAHAGTSGELRGFVDQLAARLQPWLERMGRDDPAGQPESGGAPCTWCPVCALVTAVRGHRPDAVARLAEHGAVLLAAARELLDTPPAEPAGRSRQPASGRSVQHIEVRPAAGGAGGAAGC